MKAVNKALFTDEKDNAYNQTFYELQNEAENKAMEQHYIGNEDEIDDQENEYALSYLDDCYRACKNVPEVDEECVNFSQWLDWLQYGYFI